MNLSTTRRCYAIHLSLELIGILRHLWITWSLYVKDLFIIWPITYTSLSLLWFSKVLVVVVVVVVYTLFGMKVTLGVQAYSC